MRAGDPGTVLQRAISSAGEGWDYENKWPNPMQWLGRAYIVFAGMGVVNVFSALDEFLDGVAAEYARWQAFRGASLPAITPRFSQADTQDASVTKGKVLCLDDPAFSFCKAYHWDTKPIEYLRVCMCCFRLVRNCFAHRNGRCSDALEVVARSQELKDSLAALTAAISARALLTVPSVRSGAFIVVKPRHAVLASIVTKQYAEYMNRQLCKALGESGIVYMAAYHALLRDSDPIPTQSKRAETAIGQLLGQRYNVRDADGQSVIKLLKKMDKWKLCLRRYKRLCEVTG
jgi:hypothetical protein